MFKSVLVLTLSIGGIFLAGMAPAVAQRALSDSTNGSIKVSVTDINGKPAVGVQVRLYAPRPKQTPSTSPTATTSIVPRMTEFARRGRHGPLLQGSTNNAGVYTFANVPAGDYVVRAVAGGGTSVAHARASVTAGQETDVSLNLAPRKAKPGT